MITITINNNKHQLLTSWHEITIEQCARLEAIPMPERFRDLLLGKVKDSDITYKEQVKEFPAYFGQVLCELGAIPSEVMAKVQWSDRTALYEYVAGLINDLVNRAGISYTYEGKTTFEHLGETYTLDEDLQLMEQLIPLPNTSAGEFAETADLLVALNDTREAFSTNAALLCAIILRDRSKPYNEVEVLRLADKFKTLKMSDVWEVFFSLSTGTIKRALYILNSLQGASQPEADGEHLNCLSMSLQVPIQPEHISTLGV